MPDPLDPPEPVHAHHAPLRRAIALAREARERGDHPFGALLLGADGEVLAEARNNVNTTGDPTGHAETNLVRAAAALPADTLAGATLYTSTEPCVMCSGAIYWAGIRRVVYAFPERALLELTGADAENPTFDLPCRTVFAAGQRPTAVIGPLLETEARRVHEGFWRR